MFSSEKKGPSPKEILREKSVIILQCFIRVTLARIYIKKRAFKSWKRVFDPSFKLYFWYNVINGLSQWTIPKFMTLFTETDIIAVCKLERIIRGFIHRRRAREKARQAYTRFYDADVNKFYYLNNKTQQTFWKASKWLIKQDLPMPPEDNMLYKSYLKIKQLEELLKMKEDEIKEVRLKRYEELEPEVLLDRVASAKALQRSKDMDTWSTDELAAWFTELKMEEYIPFLYQNRVDGHLFINLADSDWEDMGIVSRFHTRKLQLILKAFRYRYQRKKERQDTDEDDDLVSEYTPSELSDILNQEGEFDEDEDDEQLAGSTTIDGSSALIEVLCLSLYSINLSGAFGNIANINRSIDRSI